MNIKDRIDIILTKIYYRLIPTTLESRLSKINFQRMVKNESETIYWLAILGSEKVMNKLISDTGGGSLVDCHQEAHAVGRIAYKLYGSSVFRTKNFGCHSGFYHGAMESFLQEKGTDNLAAKINSLCKQFPTSFGNFECLHGVGHGVMAYEDYDLFNALFLCKQLDGDFAQGSCFGGVFMENIVTAQGRGAKIGHETRWVSADPHFPCNRVASFSPEAQTQCYLMQTSRMLDISGMSFDFVGKECLRSPANMRNVCFKSMGRDAAGQTLRDPVKILPICGKVPGEYFKYCIEGALNVIIDFWGEDMADQPHALCKIIDNQAEKENCYKILAKRLPEVYGSNNEKIKEKCGLFEEKYKNLCG